MTTTTTFCERSYCDVPVAELAAWHLRRGAFERLSPPWAPAVLVERPAELEDGARAVIKMGGLLMKRRWVAEHRNVDPEHGFIDVQLEGPFAYWHHAHRFEPAGPQTSRLTDEVQYRLPLGALGKLVAGRMVDNEVRRMFAYRHATTRADLATHAGYPGKPLRVAVTGSTGMVGKALVAFLTTGGHEVIELCRRDPRSGNRWIHWDADGAVGDLQALEGLDGVVHLAGENIAGGRWTKARKQAILDSRVSGTQSIIAALGKLERPPHTFIGASAIGYYGDRGEDVLDEDADPGEGFLADVCRDWESAGRGAVNLGTRVIALRLGVVISPVGGALAQSLPVFRAGIGGKIGNGKQWMSWIALDDVLGIVLHCLRTEELTGPVNAVAPKACRNAEYTRALGKTLGRPTFAPLPAWAARIALGELADALLLAGTRVAPKRLAQTGYRFRYPRIQDAMAHCLGRTRNDEAEES